MVKLVARKCALHNLYYIGSENPKPSLTQSPIMANSRKGEAASLDGDALCVGVEGLAEGGGEMLVALHLHGVDALEAALLRAVYGCGVFLGGVVQRADDVLQIVVGQCGHGMLLSARRNDLRALRNGCAASDKLALGALAVDRLRRRIRFLHGPLDDIADDDQGDKHQDTH